MSTDLTDGMMAETVEGSDVEISIDDAGVVMVNGATVTTADVPACNGVIHVIDSVLVPAADGGDDGMGGDDGTGGDNGDDTSEGNQATGGPTGGAGTGGGPSDQGSITGCARNVPSLLAKGESPINTEKRCGADCDCEEDCWYVSNILACFVTAHSGSALWFCLVILCWTFVLSLSVVILTYFISFESIDPSSAA